MPIELNKPQNSNSIIEFLETIFYRIVAIFLLIFAIRYWIQITGIVEGAQNRFDLMPEYWQIASVSLSVLFPLAALGLWGKFAWGPLIWIIAIGIETLMYLGFPELFGNKPFILLFHLFSFTIYIILFGLHLYLENKR